MYDITFICMFSFKTEKHINMAQAFSNFGLLNISGKYRVKLKALVYRDNLEDFNKLKFDPALDLEVVLSDKDGISGKIYNFYKDNFCDLGLGESRWYMQVDDDSHTDVDGLVSILDKYYDSSDPVLLTSANLSSERHRKANYFLSPEEKMERSFNRFFYYNSSLEGHTWEVYIFSSGGYKKILKKIPAKDLGEYFVSLIHRPSSSDEWLEPLSHKSRVPRVIASFIISPGNFIEDFSINGGQFFHIHYANDATFSNIFSRDYLEKNILEKDLELVFNKTSNGKSMSKRIRLTRDGFIHSDQPVYRGLKIYFGSWKINDRMLILFAKNPSSQKGLVPYAKFKINQSLRESGYLMVGQSSEMSHEPGSEFLLKSFIK